MRAKGIECITVKGFGCVREDGEGESLEARQKGVRSLGRPHREGRRALCPQAKP